ncbi:MAG: hypothetical protein HC878_09760 [Leptolyngbyaceae cyanobacterium SL_5_14]|nr:hypothetical protein [Leptolyngbyaceae cyanobacterium SL_5_14]
MVAGKRFQYAYLLKQFESQSFQCAVTKLWLGNEMNGLKTSLNEHLSQF